MSDERISNEDLRERLDRAETALDSLRRGEVDLVIGTDEPLVVQFKSLAEEKERLLQTMERMAKEWQTTFDSSNDVIWILDTEQRVQRSNRTAERLFQRPVEEMVGKHCWEIFHDAEGPIPDCPIRPMEKSMRREAVKLQVGERWQEITVDPITDKEGRCIGAVHIIRDITERKQAEAVGRRLLQAIEQVGEIVMVTDSDGVIQYVNPVFEQATGYSKEEALGRNPRFLKSGKQDEAFYREMWATISSGGTWRGRMVNKRKDGVLYTEDATISSVRDADGTIINYVAIKRDVTEHLRLQGEKTSLEKQLRQAQKMEAIGRLAGGVAHDFNNMLSVILGYGETILNQLHREDPLREKAKKIVEAGKRSAALTGQLLAFSRRQTLQPEVLDLNVIVKNLENMLGRLIGENISLDTAVAEDLARVEVDPGQIEQVIMNLAINARDAMPLGGKLIIETANVELDDLYAENHEGVAPGKYVMLAVTDTGCGMDKETLSKIFDPFFTTKERGKGTGLGLSTVYGIVKQSKGNIWVYSEPGQGTSFKIYLPQTQVELQKKESGAAREERKGRGEHILVVEDEAALRGLFESILSQRGYKVTVAANGGEALLLVEEKGLKPDMIITDVVMPVMSGSVLVERLRRNYPDLKILYMSGYTDNAIVHHGVLDPGTPFIQKPFSIRDLSIKVQEVLESARIED